MKGIWLIIIPLFLAGCTASKYMPVETVRTEYKDNVREIHTTDSVTDTRVGFINGDTVIDWRDRVKWRDRFIHDSIYIERHDSIPVPYPVELELSRWEQTKMDFGGMAIGGLIAVVIVFIIVWLIKKFKK